jgi:hypothetical protein
LLTFVRCQRHNIKPLILNLIHIFSPNANR